MVPTTTDVIDTPAGAIECLRVADGADPARGSFILLHGIQGTAASWGAVAARLGGERVILMPNLRGRGRSLSPPSPEAYTLAHFAADLHAVIEAAPAPVTLVGWSMGVLVALSYLSRHDPARLDGLVLASGTACAGTEAVWFRSDSHEGLAEEAQLRAERLALSAYAIPVAVAGAWQSVRNADLSAVLAGIVLPTLVLHGAEDDQCPLAHGRRIAEGIAGARLDVWPGAGHNLMAQDPERFAQAVLRLYAAARGDMLAATQ